MPDAIHLEGARDHERAAADQAPDAPAGAGPRVQPAVPVPGRAAILDLANDAITRNLAVPEPVA